MKSIELSLLVFDYSLYPRQSINQTHVRDMMEAERSGVDLPPILIDEKSKRIVDGFHRATVKKRLYGGSAEIGVETKSYRTEKEMLLDAIRLNAVHGLHMDPCDRARAILLATKLNIHPKALANALHVSVDKVNELTVRKTSPTNGGSVAIKNTIRHMAGTKLNKRQVAANDKLGGMQQGFYANQLIILIQSDLLDVDNKNLMDRLEKLHRLLDDLFVNAAS